MISRRCGRRWTRTAFSSTIICAGCWGCLLNLKVSARENLFVLFSTFVLYSLRIYGMIHDTVRYCTRHVLYSTVPGHSGGTRVPGNTVSTTVDQLRYQPCQQCQQCQCQQCNIKINKIRISTNQHLVARQASICCWTAVVRTGTKWSASPC